MNPLTKLSAKNQLLILFMILISPVFVLNWYANKKATDILKNQMTDAYVELIKQNHEIINRDLDTIHKITTAIIKDPLTQQMAYNANETTYQRVLKYSEMDRMLAGISAGVDGAETIAYSFVAVDPNRDYFFAPSYRHANRGVFFCFRRRHAGLVSGGHKPERDRESCG